MARKQLTYFRPIAETDGLTDLVCDLLSDLKRQEIWPDELHQICHSRGGHQKDCELADLYERYRRF